MQRFDVTPKLTLPRMQLALQLRRLWPLSRGSGAELVRGIPQRACKGIEHAVKACDRQPARQQNLPCKRRVVGRAAVAVVAPAAAKAVAPVTRQPAAAMRPPPAKTTAVEPPRRGPRRRRPSRSGCPAGGLAAVPTQEDPLCQSSASRRLTAPCGTPRRNRFGLYSQLRSVCRDGVTTLGPATCALGPLWTVNST